MPSRRRLADVDRWDHERSLAAGLDGDVVRVADLRALGLTRDEQEQALRGLSRIRRGAYLAAQDESAAESRSPTAGHVVDATNMPARRSASVPAPNDPLLAPAREHIALLRAVLAERPDAVASHTSAALLNGLPLSPADLGMVHVSLAGGASRRGRRFGVHTHVRRIPIDQVVEVAGLRATCASTTVIDCARLLPMPAGLSIADAALHEGLTTRGQLVRELGAFRTMKGVATARRVVDLADPEAESPGESRTRLILVEAGFSVRSQVVVRDGDGELIARCDLGIEGSRMVVEFDGRAKYAINGDVERAHWEEKLRRDRLQELGYSMFVVVWDQLSEPMMLVARLERALRAVGSDPGALRRLAHRRADAPLKGKRAIR